MWLHAHMRRRHGKQLMCNRHASATSYQGLLNRGQYRHLMLTQPQVCCMISLRPFARCAQLLSGLRNSLRDICGLNKACHRPCRVQRLFQLHAMQMISLAAAVAGCNFIAYAMCAKAAVRRVWHVL